MASRDIANMHLFLDLKKTFPDLPDDTLRHYAILYAEDRDKCMHLLKKESDNHHHPSQPFSDFRLSDTKSSKKIEGGKILKNQNSIDFSTSSKNLPLSFDFTSLSNKYQQAVGSDRSANHSGVNSLPNSSLNFVQLKPDSQSAPVVAVAHMPFANAYKHAVTSSCSAERQIPCNDDDNRLVFLTTKEHAIRPPVLLSNDPSSSRLSVLPNKEPSKRHEVKLSITPSFPFQQQQINVLNNIMSASASHSSRPGHHMTSVNFQLQPHSSDQYPLEISTIPTNIGDPCNYRDFGSHVQISVGAQGATFTALRVHRPSPVVSQQPNYVSPHLSPTDNTSHNFPQSSDPEKNSKSCMFPNRIQHQTLSSASSKDVSHRDVCTKEGSQLLYEEGIVSHHQPPLSQSSQVQDSSSTRRKIPKLFPRNIQTSSDYIEAVKSHQISQLDMILEELEKEKVVCSQLKSEVHKLEQEITQIRAKKTLFPYLEELEKLREQNRKLSIEISCLSMEVDMYSSGQIPLGETDADFYSHIFTGPNGTITSLSKTGEATSNKGSFQQIQLKKPISDEDDDEQNTWRCKKCTFANHPALEKCEMCELPKSSGLFFDDS